MSRSVTGTGVSLNRIYAARRQRWLTSSYRWGSTESLWWAECRSTGVLFIRAISCGRTVKLIADALATKQHFAPADNALAQIRTLGWVEFVGIDRIHLRHCPRKKIGSLVETLIGLLDPKLGRVDV